MRRCNSGSGNDHCFLLLLLVVSSALAATWCVAAVRGAGAFYVPGVAPVDYETGAELAVKTTKITSKRSVLPFNYYSLPFCRPAEIERYSENLGELLSGARVSSTAFELRMKQDANCRVLCVKQLSRREATLFGRRIAEEYRALLQLDNLPVGQPVYAADGSKVAMERGYPIGAVDDARNVYLNNHLSFRVLVHRPRSRFTGDADGYRVVGFEVTPMSVRHVVSAGSENAAVEDMRLETCSRESGGVVQTAERQMVNSATRVVFTYDVKYEESPIAWASRWDLYLQQPGPGASVHWFSIINSSLIVLFLSATVAMILLRTVAQDFARYNNLEDEEDEDEYGWKLVHGDVFRTPPNVGMLSVLVGSGVQVLFMALVVLLFAVAGFLSPANRGGLLTAVVLLWVLMSLPAGYTSARLYKSFRGTAPKRVTLLTAVLFPGTAFAVFFLLNLVLWASHSSGALPFFSLLFMLVLWFGISVPLAFFGSYLGYRKPAVDFPTRTNVIPRQVPPVPVYARGYAAVAFGGLLPFGSVFLSLFFILSSVFLNQYYYWFGFLFLSVVILLVTTAENSLVFTYVRLSAEDWRWQWYSFLVSAAAGAYMFLYSLLYLYQRPEFNGMTALSGVLYVVYMWLASVAFGLMVGAVGFLSAMYFVLKIYAAIKVD